MIAVMFPFEPYKPDNITPPVPQPGFIPVINYWRALQLLKQTPFQKLWAATKKEAPGILAVFVFAFVCLASVVFTACWCVVAVLKMLYSVVVRLISLLVKK